MQIGEHSVGTSTVSLTSNQSFHSGCVEEVEVRIVDREQKSRIESIHAEFLMFLRDGRSTTNHRFGEQVVVSDLPAQEGPITKVRSGIELPDKTPPTVGAVDVYILFTYRLSDGTERRKEPIVVAPSQIHTSIVEQAVDEGLKLSDILVLAAADSGESHVREYVFSEEGRRQFVTVRIKQQSRDVEIRWDDGSTLLLETDDLPAQLNSRGRLFTEA